MPYKDLDKRKEASCKSSKRWSETHRAEAAANARAWRKRNPKYMLFKAAERRARNEGTPFNLKLEDVPDIPKTCPIALIPLFVRDDGGRGPCENSPSLDRIKPELGYVIGNIRVISFKGNRWKSDMTVEDMERLIRYSLGEL